MNFLSQLFILLIRGYQLLISPFIPSSCRFQPSCSQYAIDGIKQSGIKAIPNILKRIFRCHPFGSSGFDPYRVPKEKNRAKNPKQLNIS